MCVCVLGVNSECGNVVSGEWVYKGRKEVKGINGKQGSRYFLLQRVW